MVTWHEGPSKGIWSLAQVRAVQSLRSRHSENPVTLARVRDPEAMARVIAEKLRDQLMRAAQTHAVDLHPADIQCRSWSETLGEDEESGDPGLQLLQYEARWAPETTEVLMVHRTDAEGDLVTVNPRMMGRPILVEVYPTREAPDAGFTWQDRQVEPTRWVYELSGWDERNRRWIYSTSAPSTGVENPVDDSNHDQEQSP